MAVQTHIATRDLWWRHNGTLKCSAVTGENHLLLRSRHRGIKQGPIEQTALDDWDNHAAELRALSLVSGDSVGKSQVIEAAPSYQMLLVVEVDSKHILITVADHPQRGELWT